MSLFSKIFGEREDAQVKKIRPMVELVNAFEDAIKNMTDAELRAKTVEFKQRLEGTETIDDLLPEAFAVVREAGVRTIGLRHYDVQVIGGIVLHQGRIAEMKTGEGKTLVSTLAAYLNALSGQGVHVVTVNDYLAKRDAEWMGKIHKFLGLTVGVILSQISPEERRHAYSCDITYGTNSEFGFDYLRDNMCVYKRDMVQRKLNFAIVDEVDSILIDEARTPLIISGKGEDSTEMYVKADKFVKTLSRGEDTTEQSKFETLSMTSEEAFANTGDYTVDEKLRTVSLTSNGVDKAEAFFGVERLTDADNTEINHHIQQALKANYLFKNDVDYVIQEEQIMIVDEFTGRIMHGRRYSEGLHQAIEAKEGVAVKNESKTLATITYQNFFRMYQKLSGMTGTAKTEEEEFQGIYKLDVVVIPTNRPNVREDFDDVIYIEEEAKESAIVEEIIEQHAKLRPILVGTISVEKSEHLSRLISLRGIEHVVLNAKNHKKEADIVAQAGQLGIVTIATNMAGRGTDILLGGNADYMARRAMRQVGISEEIIEEATGHAETEHQEILDARELYAQKYAEFKKQTDIEHDKVVALGGLHIIGTERHESRRIDNQLRGRAGRQGDPGSTKFFLSLDDELLRLFGGENLKKLAGKFSSLKDTPMEMGMLTKQIENAQKRVESMHFSSRKHVLQYDDVMNKQREVIYAQRRRVLVGEDISDAINLMIKQFIQDQVNTYCASGVSVSEWDILGLERKLSIALLPEGEKLDLSSINKDNSENQVKKDLIQILLDNAKEIYSGREAELQQYNLSMRDAEREVMLRVVDMHWMDHIDAMDHLRDGINLQAYAQRDPAQEYAVQGFDMFEHMIESINETTVTALMHVSVQGIPKERKQVSSGELNAHQEQAQDQEQAQQNQQQNIRSAQKNTTEAPRPFVDKTKKVGRNDPCPCGSGKKYKNCHANISEDNLD